MNVRGIYITYKRTLDQQQQEIYIIFIRCTIDQKFGVTVMLCIEKLRFCFNLENHLLK